MLGGKPGLLTMNSSVAYYIFGYDELFIQTACPGAQ